MRFHPIRRGGIDTHKIKINKLKSNFFQLFHTKSSDKEKF